MGMSYRAAMVPMMLTVVGTGVTPISVTGPVGIGTLLATFFTANAWVSRMANKTTAATTTAPIATAAHRLRRAANGDAIDWGYSLDALITRHPRDNFLCPG